eukprot:3646043-Pyramimonas_sp.AAC.2
MYAWADEEESYEDALKRISHLQVSRRRNTYRHNKSSMQHENNGRKPSSRSDDWCALSSATDDDW